MRLLVPFLMKYMTGKMNKKFYNQFNQNNSSEKEGDITIKPKKKKKKSDLDDIGDYVDFEEVDE
ncbi:hypothetical protein N9T80_00295 [bacterium]|nr:hypothetical protein [bacterium]